MIQIHKANEIYFQDKKIDRFCSENYEERKYSKYSLKGRIKNKNRIQKFKEVKQILNGDSDDRI